MLTKSNSPTPLPSTCSAPVAWNELDGHLAQFEKEVLLKLLLAMVTAFWKLQERASKV